MINPKEAKIRSIVCSLLQLGFCICAIISLFSGEYVTTLVNLVASELFSVERELIELKMNKKNSK